MKEIKEIELVEENLDSLESENDTKEPIENTNELQKKSKTTDDNTSKIVKNDNKKTHNKKLIILSIIFCVFVLLILSTIFALLNSNKNTIIYGISIKGVDISGLTKEEAYDKIVAVVNDKLSTPFDLIHNDNKTTIIPEQFGANFDIESSINTAYERGRNDNIFKNNFEIVSSFFFKVNIIPSFSYNEEAVNSLISEIQANLPDRLIETNYYIDGSNLIVTKGVDGVKIEPDVLKLKIILTELNLQIRR